MSKVIQPSDPLRSDHREIKNLLHTMGKDSQVQHLPREYDWVIGTFRGMGGSWEEVSKGGVAQISLLKKIIKHAIKRKILSPASKWAGYGGGDSG